MVARVVVSCCLLLAASLPVAHATAPEAEAPDVEAIDFEAAFAAARRSLRQGASVDDAADIAERVLSGEASFEPLGSGEDGTQDWLYAEQWLTAKDAQLLQHEVITSSGWRKPDGTTSGLLDLSTPLPAWAQGIAEKLGPALGREPDRCAVHALEPGQAADVLSEPCDASSVAALLSIGSEARLTSRTQAVAARTVTTLDARSVLLVAPAASARQLCVQCGDSRHLSLTFWSSPRKG